jgi:hypothetical protein
MSNSADGQRGPVIALAWGEICIALGVIGIAFLAWWQTTRIPVSPLYSKVGPTVAPTIAWIGLMILGFALLYAAIRGGWQTEEEKETPTDRPALAWVVGGLVANVLLIGGFSVPGLVVIPPAGFTVASVVMFLAISRGFGSRQPLRDAGIAIALTLTAYFGFAQALGIDIGRGIVENAIFSLLGTSP